MLPRTQQGGLDADDLIGAEGAGAQSRKPPPSWLVHVPFALLVVAALVPRVVALVGYRPLLMFFGDSQTYLIAAQSSQLSTSRPFGYSAFLRLMSWTHEIWTIALIQHLAIIFLAIILYSTLLHLNAPVWLALIVPAPMLLDGYQILIEHVAMTEVLFSILIVGALLVAIRRRFTLGSGLVVGVLLAAATLTRTVALPVIAIMLAYLIARRVSWKSICACIVAFCLPIVAYAGWFLATYDTFAIQKDGRFLYARVAPIGDCTRLTLSNAARELCDSTPLDARPGSNFYAWDRTSPFNQIPKGQTAVAIGQQREVEGREFGVAVITQQPLDYARLVAHDLVHYFSPGRFSSVQDTPPSWWDFPLVPARPDQQVVLSGSDFADDKSDVSLSQQAATFLRGWQSVFGTQGLFLLLCLLLGIAGAVVGRRIKGGARRLDPLLFAATGTALIVVPSATSVFDYRYALPAAIPLYAAAGWGILLLLQARQLRGLQGHEVVELTAFDDVFVPNRHRARNRLTPWLTTGTFIVLVLAVVLAPVRNEPIYARYARAGAERSVLGYSKDSVHPLVSNTDWSIRNFDGGSVYLSPGSNTYVITSDTENAYRRGGGQAVFGLPLTGTSTLRQFGRESVTWFERGVIVYSQKRGARTVLPPLIDGWCFPTSPCTLGVPLANAQRQANGTLKQEFTGGSLVSQLDGSVKELPRKSSTVTPELPTDAVLPPDVRGG